MFSLVLNKVKINKGICIKRIITRILWDGSSFQTIGDRTSMCLFHSEIVSHSRHDVILWWNKTLINLFRVIRVTIHRNFINICCIIKNYNKELWIFSERKIRKVGLYLWTDDFLEQIRKNDRELRKTNRELGTDMRNLERKEKELVGYHIPTK